MWITREILWIKRFNWGKLAILFEIHLWSHPHIWGVTDEYAEIFSIGVGWRFSQVLSSAHPQQGGDKTTCSIPLYLPTGRAGLPIYRGEIIRVTAYPHIHRPYYDYY